MSKYTGKLQEKKATTNFITNVIYYNTKKLQINLTLKVSSQETESLIREVEKFSKLDVSMVSRGFFHFVPKEPLLSKVKFRS